MLRHFLFSLLIGWALMGCAPSPASYSQGKTSDLFSEHSITDFGLRATKKVALTFDDGPGAGTAEILDTLKEFKIHATFFVLGKSAAAFPALMERIAAEGHTVANHSYSHKDLSRGRYANSAVLVNDLLSTHTAIAKYQDPALGKYFRAPFGKWHDRNALPLNSNPSLSGYVGPVFWDIGGAMSKNGAADWACWKKRVTIEACLNGYLLETESKQGGVVLFHDITTKSANMVRQYIEILIKRGYSFTTLEELIPVEPRTAAR